jgi:hypothetical protein
MRFSTPARDADFIEFTLNARQVNEIRHMVPLDSLIMFTSDAEWRMTEGRDQVLTPYSVGVRPQSYNGCSWVPPVVVNDSALYIQAKGNKVRDLSFDGSRYTGSDLSIMADHLVEGHQIEEMAFTDEPYGILWMIRDDGILLGMTYQREHKIWGWHQHTTDGIFESVASVSEGDRDVLYAVVKRTVNGTDVRYVERFEERITTSAEDAFCVDSGLSYDGNNTSSTTMTTSTAGGWDPVDDITITAGVGTPFAAGDVGDAIVLIDSSGKKYTLTIKTYTSSTVVVARTDVTLPVALQGLIGTTWAWARLDFAGLTHLETKDVTVTADGNEVTGITVSSGSVTLPYPAVKVHVGLGYTPTLETMDIDFPVKDGAFRDKEISVSHVTLEVEDTRGGWIGPKLEDGTAVDMLEIKPRYESDAYDELALKTFKQEILIKPEWSRSGAIRIEQRSPFPIEVLSIIPRFDVGGS